MFKRMSLFLVAALAAGVMSCSADGFKPSEKKINYDAETGMLSVQYFPTDDEIANNPVVATYECYPVSPETAELVLKVYDLEQSLKAQGFETNQKFELLKKAYEVALQPGIMQKIKETLKNLYANKGLVAAYTWRIARAAAMGGLWGHFCEIFLVDKIGYLPALFASFVGGVGIGTLDVRVDQGLQDAYCYRAGHI